MMTVPMFAADEICVLRDEHFTYVHARLKAVRHRHIAVVIHVCDGSEAVRQEGDFLRPAQLCFQFGYCVHRLPGAPFGLAYSWPAKMPLRSAAEFCASVTDLVTSPNTSPSPCGMFVACALPMLARRLLAVCVAALPMSPPDCASAIICCRVASSVACSLATPLSVCCCAPTVPFAMSSASSLPASVEAEPPVSPPRASEKRLLRAAMPC